VNPIHPMRKKNRLNGRKRSSIPVLP
jgi:hypothetical protein